MGDWYLRRYEPSDEPKLKTFTCSTPGQKWTKVPQKLIRDTPALLGNPEEDIRVLLACQVRDRRREGIGWALKRAALADFLADSPERDVVSHVHRKNSPMNGLNAKLGAGTTKDPEDGDLLITVVTVVPPKDRQPWHGPADAIARLARSTVPGPWRRPIR